LSIPSAIYSDVFEDFPWLGLLQIIDQMFDKVKEQLTGKRPIDKVRESHYTEEIASESRW
jgi:hypothetical protein